LPNLPDLPGFPQALCAFFETKRSPERFFVKSGVLGMDVLDTGITPPFRHLDLAIVRSFVLIAEGRSFGETAQLMQRSPSAITLQIQKLEEFLGRALLNRSGRTISLTPEGEAFFREVKPILAANDALLERFRHTVEAA
jgi:hypothetical protein